jgi:hypothetical protein
MCAKIRPFEGDEAGISTLLVTHIVYHCFNCSAVDGERH